jgi:glycosyltransferase involved in cell wall biosynthesis
VYNGEKYLAGSIEALLGQTYTDFELIISDNASTDGTADICKEFLSLDSRIRYFRQPVNIGSAPNHNFTFQQARGELFKWAASDDLYARTLLERCVAAIDEHPEAVLAHSWTAAIDDADNLVQALEYPLETNSPSAPARFCSMLFGTGEDDQGLIRADDQYGVIRSEVLRKIGPQGSFYHSDRVIMADLVLHGPFYQVPEWLYFRRDHSGRPQHATPSVRGWCANLDPNRANRFRHPAARLLAEYLLGYAKAIRKAPLSNQDRRACYGHLVRWTASRFLPALVRAARGGILATNSPVPVPPPPSGLSLDVVVAKRNGQDHSVQAMASNSEPVPPL